MKLPIQAQPVHRQAVRDNSNWKGMLPSNWQCWTEQNCQGLATAYGDALAECCDRPGIQSARGINEHTNQGCWNCDMQLPSTSSESSESSDSIDEYTPLIPTRRSTSLF